MFLYLGALIACNGIDSQEAELIFNALYEPLGDLRDMALDIEDDEIEDGNLSISLPSPGQGWEGDISAAGSKEEQGPTKVYRLQLSMDIYSARSNINLSGEASFNASYILEQTDAASYQKAFFIDGDLTVEGDANGIADLGYSITETFSSSEDSTAVDTTGDISGTDVQDFLSGAKQ